MAARRFLAPLEMTVMGNRPEKLLGLQSLFYIHHKIERCHLARVRVLHRDDEFRAKDRIPLIASFIREKKLCGQFGLVRRLDFDVDVPRAPRIQSWDDGFKMIASGIICQLESAHLVACIVVRALTIRLPEIHACARDSLATCCEHVPGKNDPGSRYPWLYQIETLGRILLIVWTFGHGWCYVECGAASGCRRNRACDESLSRRGECGCRLRCCRWK